MGQAQSTHGTSWLHLRGTWPGEGLRLTRQLLVTFWWSVMWTMRRPSGVHLTTLAKNQEEKTSWLWKTHCLCKITQVWISEVGLLEEMTSNLVALFFSISDVPCALPTRTVAVDSFKAEGDREGQNLGGRRTCAGNGKRQGSKVRILGRKGTLGIREPRKSNQFLFLVSPPTGWLTSGVLDACPDKDSEAVCLTQPEGMVY